MTTNFQKQEDERLQELLKYAILDTPDEEDFDDVVKLASFVCDAPISLLTFVDDCRQWFKARFGWEYRETGKDVSFCAHTINANDYLEIRDALLDERFCHNPLVLEGPKVRFYAGVPLISPSGYKLGALCVLDRVPRKLTEEQVSALKALAKYIVHLLELRFKKQKLAISREEHELLRQRMLKEQRTLTRVQKAASIGMFEMDLKGRTLKVSEGFCHLFGIKSAVELNVDDYLTLIHPDDLPEFISYFKNIIASNSIRFAYDYRCHKRNTRKELFIRVTGEIVRGEAGEALKIIGVKQDISNQKRYELQLVNQNAELMKVNQELDNFVYRVSHDLRAPISSLLGLVDIITAEQDINAVKELLLLVKKTLEKQDKFIKDILDYSRNSRQEVQPEYINFEELLPDLFAQFSYSSLWGKIDYRYEVEEQQAFYTDLYRLRIILNNLISNAFKYQHSGREQGWVRVKVKADDFGATITVADNGIGISKEHLDKVFNMFYRATDQQPGSGLGLYIVRETALKLKGEVSIESLQGKGTTIKVRLPNLIPAGEATVNT